MKNVKKIIGSVVAVGATVLALVGIIRYKNKKNSEEYDDELYFEDEDDTEDAEDAADAENAEDVKDAEDTDKAETEE